MSPFVAMGLVVLGIVLAGAIAEGYFRLKAQDQARKLIKSLDNGREP